VLLQLYCPSSASEPFDAILAELRVRLGMMDSRLERLLRPHWNPSAFVAREPFVIARILEVRSVAYTGRIPDGHKR
jgi:hypothetical protein